MEASADLRPVPGGSVDRAEGIAVHRRLPRNLTGVLQQAHHQTSLREYRAASWMPAPEIRGRKLDDTLTLVVGFTETRRPLAIHPAMGLVGSPDPTRLRG